MSKKIIELMQVPVDQHDIDWLKQSLQSAVELELSTLPPYLCGLWSIKDTTSTVYELIREVAMEEMLHMGLACNMLTTIGGIPQIDTSIPTYPGPLPGGVRPELTVYLAGLSKDYVQKVYMQIEYPEQGPITLLQEENYPTIGAFYDAIGNAFYKLLPTDFTGKNQLTATFGPGNSVFPINGVADAKKAIETIKEQGEGTSQSPAATDFGGELAHYYKFGEIWNGNTFVQQTDGSWQYKGAPIPFPDVYPIPPIPNGGYINTTKEVQDALKAFNSLFTLLLSGLQDAWEGHGEDALNEAIGYMFGLKDLATAIMQFELPDGAGVYGPEFILSN